MKREGSRRQKAALFRYRDSQFFEANEEAMKSRREREEVDDERETKSFDKKDKRLTHSGRRETHSDSSVITTAVWLDLIKRMTASLSRSSETRERIKDGSSE